MNVANICAKLLHVKLFRVKYQPVLMATFTIISSGNHFAENVLLSRLL